MKIGSLMKEADECHSDEKTYTCLADHRTS